MRARAAAVGFVFALATVAAADDGPVTRVELDKRIARVAHDGALLGSQLYNKGNHEGCLRLYQGTLLALHPLLDHHPKLAEFVKNRLAAAAALDAVKGSYALREGLDAVLAETVPALAGPKKALWDRLGGEKAVRAVVKDFLAAAAADPKVNLTRDGKFKLDDAGKAKLEQQLVEVVSVGTGGALKYSGKDIAADFAGRYFTNDEFITMGRHLMLSLVKQNIPERERVELIELIGSKRDLIVGK